MAVIIRPFTSDDYPTMVAARNAAYPDYPESIEDWHHFDENLDQRCPLVRFVAEVNGKIVGSVQAHQMPWAYHPQKFVLGLSVDPAYQNRGIGRRLYDAMMEELAPQNPISFLASLRDDWAAAKHFALSRGFEVKMHYWESWLNIPQFDPAPFLPVIDKVLGQGIRIITLGEAMANDPDHARKIYRLVQDVLADVPMPEPYTEVAYDVWYKGFFSNPNILPDGYFLAVDGEQYVGLSALWQIHGLQDLQTGLTGVLRSHRRRGIALALKLKALEYARNYGATYVRTGNEQNNRAMLSINEMLGFAKMPPWMDLIKQVRAETSEELEVAEQA